METTCNLISDRVRASVRAFGLQKQLASDMGISDADLSKFLECQLPRFCKLLEKLNLDVVDIHHVADLRRVLKEVL